MNFIDFIKIAFISVLIYLTLSRIDEITRRRKKKVFRLCIPEEDQKILKILAKKQNLSLQNYVSQIILEAAEDGSLEKAARILHTRKAFFSKENKGDIG